MSELETRLAEALAGTAERSPHPGDLAAGARARLRRRRRTTTAVVAAALAVTAIPVGLTALGGGDVDGERPDRRESTVADPVPDDWRTETWRDLSVRVPGQWGRGGGTTWCTAGSLGAQVSRPGVVATIDCTPSYGYGAHFLEPSGELPPGTEGVVQQYRGTRYPAGAWIGYASTQQAAVWVVAGDRTTARRVLDSTAPVGEVDANGCATRLEMSASSAAERVSVCRYDRDGWLEQSELLAPADSREAVAAVAGAPWSESGVGCELGLTSGRPVVVMVGAGHYAQVAWSGPCAGVDVGADEMPLRQVTEDVLFWALSPGWSGSLPSGVPAPDRLRTR